jgi:AP-3 complex subunit beta
MACIKSPHGGDSIHSTLTARSSGLSILADPVVASAVVELKTLVQAQMHTATPTGSSSAPLTIVERLAYRMDEIRHSKARACVVWLVGQYAADESPGTVVEGVAPWAPDVLRKVAKSFREEVRCCHSPLNTGSVEFVR